MRIQNSTENVQKRLDSPLDTRDEPFVCENYYVCLTLSVNTINMAKKFLKQFYDKITCDK